MAKVKCLRREAGDLMVEWSCKGENGEFHICGHCQSCVLQDKLHRFTQWMQKTGGASRGRFLTGILVRCQNLQILENLQSVLQVTSGKDFTYARSRAQFKKPDDIIDATWSTELHGMDVLETWEWFRKSPDWTKSNYLLGVLSLCDSPLLHMLGNLVHILIAWEKHRFLKFNNADVSVTESCFSDCSDKHSNLDLLIQACSEYMPADLPQETQQGGQTDALKQECLEHKSAAEFACEGDVRCLNVWRPAQERKLLQNSCEELEEMDMQSRGPWNTQRKDRDSGSDCSDDPALTVVPRSSKSLSGVRRHTDFIRRLPVDITKRILGLLDKPSLYSCKHVSKHWHCLSEEILTEMEVKKSVWKQAMILQGNSTFRVNPVYAKVCEVQVPISEEEKQFQIGESFSKRESQEYDLNSIYKGIETKTVQMEERNVYCGVYNILVLLEREDPRRVMHYAGGQLVVVSSRDRTVRLLDVVSLKEVSPVFQGHAGSIRAVLLCEEKDLVISASYDLSIRCWDLKTGVCTVIFHGHFGTINCLDLCGDRLVSGAKDCRVKVWNLVTRRCIDNLKFKHPKPIMCVKIDETVVISSCAGGLVRMWSLETASLLRQISGHQGAVLCLCLDQWHILSGGSDGLVKVWSTNCSFKKCLRTFQHPKEVLTMSFLCLRVITGCMDGKIRIFNFLNGDCLRVIKTNMQQSPVLSLHTHNNTVVVNTRGSVVILQFAEVHWDYSASAVRDFFSRSHTSDRGLWSAEITRVGSTSPKCLSSTPILQHAQDALQESRRVATWSKLQAYRCSRAIIDPQPKLLTEPRSVVSAGRPVSGYREGFQSRVNHTPAAWRATISLDKDIKSMVLSQSEKAVRERMRKRGPHHPETLDIISLRTNSSQQGHCSELARSNMELNAKVRDAWGPDSSRGSQHTDFASLISKTPTSHPSSHKPSTETTFKKSAKIGTTHNLNPQRFLKSRQSSLLIHSPAQLEADCPRGSPPKHSQRSLKGAIAGINKISPLNITSQENDKSPQRLFMRRTATTPVPRKFCHVDADMARTEHNPLDPFREHGGFQLRTDTQLEAFFQEQTRQQIHIHDSGDQSKTVWKHIHCPQ